jgi:hypothetical protein
MLQSSSLGSREKIRDSDPTAFFTRRVVVKGGSITIVTLCILGNADILRVWIPDSIIFLNWDRPVGRFGIGKRYGPLESIVFESNSRLTQTESELFYDSSLQSILIPSGVEILGSKCFSRCKSLSFITFESNSRLTQIESEAFSYSSL